MADVELTAAEEEGGLPPLCMCCGEPATAFVERTLPLAPPTVGGPRIDLAEVFLVRVLVAMANTPTLRLRTSFCEQHRHYWTMRFALMWGGLAAFLAVIVGGLAFVVLLIVAAKVDAPWLSCVVIVPTMLFLVAWIIPLQLVAVKTIRVRANERDQVILQNVHDGFADAVRAQRQ